MADLLRKYKSNYSSTANSFGTGTGETITPSSVSGLPTDTEITLTFDRVDSDGEPLGTTERIIGSISGGNFVPRSTPTSGRGIDGTSDQAHTSPVVEMIWNAKDWNDLIDHILTQHDQAGRHTNITASNISASAVVTGSNFDLLASGAIRDANDNELFNFGQVASAVNNLHVSNAITGSNVTASMAGGDTDIGLDLKMKGAGRFRKPSVVNIQVVDAATATATGDAKAFFRIPAELNGMNLVNVAAAVYTAGTTNTTDIQIRNKTQTADMLSTKITIDSTETDSATAAAPAVIDTGNDDVATGDILAIDVDAVHSTPASGLSIEMRFALP